MAVTPYHLRNAIAEVLWERVGANELPDVCVGLGMSPGETIESNASKRAYVRKRIVDWKLPALADLARQVADDFGSDELETLIAGLGARGVDGALKNLIFAADGPKPRIVLTDALNNTIEIVENAEYCLVYDEALPADGLSWNQMANWWARTQHKRSSPTDAIQSDLYQRLYRSLDSEPEQTLFQSYMKRCRADGDLPALIPQVYLQYDPYTRRKLGTTGQVLTRERTDFLFLLPRRARVVLEIDGKHHYTEDGSDRSSPRKYAQMVRADRQVRLDGYDVYRFGGLEFFPWPTLRRCWTSSSMPC